MGCQKTSLSLVSREEVRRKRRASEDSFFLPKQVTRSDVGFGSCSNWGSYQPSSQGSLSLYFPSLGACTRHLFFHYFFLVVLSKRFHRNKEIGKKCCRTVCYLVGELGVCQHYSQLWLRISVNDEYSNIECVYLSVYMYVCVCVFVFVCVAVHICIPFLLNKLTG